MSLARFDIAGTRQRILDQYRASPRLIALFEALIDAPMGEIKATALQLLGRLDIDTMQGVQLDLIGSIIGRPRPTTLDDIYTLIPGAFEFKNAAETEILLLAPGDDALETDEDVYLSIGVPGDDDPGGAFDTIGDDGFPALTGGPFNTINPMPVMQDVDYRRLLKATIYLNTSGATVPEMEFYGKFVLGVRVSVGNTPNAITLEFARPLTPQETAIIQATLLPAAGIRVSDFVINPDPLPDLEDGFGFAGLDGLTGFGTVGELQVGSGFATVI